VFHKLWNDTGTKNTVIKIENSKYYSNVVSDPIQNYSLTPDLDPKSIVSDPQHCSYVNIKNYSKTFA
jgi:hypothetical protein